MTTLRIAIAGLGAAAKLVLPYFSKVEGVRLAGAADVRADARSAFESAYGLPGFASVEELCRSPDVDAVWIETPNHLHCAHAVTAARHGKHVICAKPLATSLEECDRMIGAARENGVKLLLGHSKTLDAPIRAMAEIARSGRLGRVIQIDSWLYNDWLRRPRLAEELDDAKGAGFLMRQAPHLVEIATYIAGAGATRVRAMAGQWDENMPTKGNAAALIAFETGAFANISLNGYGYFDGSELTFGIGSMGDARERRRPRPRGAPLTSDEKYAAPSEADLRQQGEAQPFFGLTVVSCERGVMRQSPHGILVYTDEGCEEISLPPHQGRSAELIELRDAVRDNRDVFPDGGWGKATLATCLAILCSAGAGADVTIEAP